MDLEQMEPLVDVMKPSASAFGSSALVGAARASVTNATMERCLIMGAPLVVNFPANFRQ